MRLTEEAERRLFSQASRAVSEPSAATSLSWPSSLSFPAAYSRLHEESQEGMAPNHGLWVRR